MVLTMPVDYAKAIFWLRRAFESGYAKAAYQLGNFYLDTDGMQHDYSQAVHWWRLAAEQGEWDAQHNLADLYFIGDHIPQDYGEAIHWWSKASEEFCDGEADERLEDIYYDETRHHADPLPVSASINQPATDSWDLHKDCVNEWITATPAYHQAGHLVLLS
jgi:TPR repeat protein